MANEPTRVWQPGWSIPPGEILLEALQERGMTQAELARRMDRPLKTINEIIKGKTAITPETAIQLELALGITARFWNGLETNFREYLAREQVRRELAAQAGWVDEFPLKDLIRHKLIGRRPSKAETLADLLSYFGVSSPAAWGRHWLQPSASFRSSPTFMASPKAVAAWLRWGEIEAARVASGPFNAPRFRKVLREIRPLTRGAVFMQVFEKVQKLCAEAGVIVILTPEFEGTRLSGAARWLAADKALIQLSLRHKSNDHFWFSFFHEAGHLLQPSRRQDFLDAAEEERAAEEIASAEELSADRFARDELIPPAEYDALLERKEFSAAAIRAFAKDQGIAPGIVVGRLQRDGFVKHQSHLNDLKKPVHWGS